MGIVYYERIDDMFYVIRGILLAALLLFVWKGDMWAIKLAITLSAIGIEGLAYVMRRN